MSVSATPLASGTKADMNPNADIYKCLEQYPELNVTFSKWETAEIRQSWASMRDDELETSKEKANVGTASAFFCQQFYENLLGEYPELSVLFPSIKSQASSMAGILSLVIAQLDNITNIRGVLVSLGKRHSRIIGVEATHYELVGNALLRTLADRLQDNFTPELENAWIKFFTYITNLMLQAGEDPPLPTQTLYPVLTPTDSNASSISAVARRALKPRLSDLSSKDGSVSNTNTNNQSQSAANASSSFSSAAAAAAAPSHSSTSHSASANATTGMPGALPTTASFDATNSRTAPAYSPANSHFKVQGKVKKRRGGGKGQECMIM